MAVSPQRVARRLFEEIEAEYFDFTITVSDTEDDRRWLQLRGNSINLPYPHSEPPESVLPAFGLFGDVEWDVDGWQAGLFVTIDWGPLGEPADERLAEIITRVLANYLELPAGSDRWVVSEE